MNLKVNYSEHAFVPVYQNVLIIKPISSFNQEALTRYNIIYICI